MLPLPHPNPPEPIPAAPRPDDPVARLHRATGLTRLNPVWAKLEIFLGLIGVGAGLFLIVRGRQDDWVVAGVVLFALGGYLALAGHRSHLYQSNNRLAAYLAELIRSRTSGDR